MRGRTKFDPPRFMSVNEAIEQLLATEESKGEGGELGGLLLFMDQTLHWNCVPQNVHSHPDNMINRHSRLSMCHTQQNQPIVALARTHPAHGMWLRSCIHVHACATCRVLCCSLWP